MNQQLQLKTGGQWLVMPTGEHKIFCRESFSDEHREIEDMVFKFSENRISPNVQNIEKPRFYFFSDSRSFNLPPKLALNQS